MAKKKAATDEVKETKERAAVGRERRLALALVGLIDTVESGGSSDGAELREAKSLLSDLGYSQLESTQRTLARINEHIKDAVAAGDGERLAELGKELQKAQSGKFRLTSTPTASDADGK